MPFEGFELPSHYRNILIIISLIQECHIHFLSSHRFSFYVTNFLTIYDYLLKTGEWEALLSVNSVILDRVVVTGK